jgi:hypothetical protein
MKKLLLSLALVLTARTFAQDTPLEISGSADLTTSMTLNQQTFQQVLLLIKTHS